MVRRVLVALDGIGSWEAALTSLRDQQGRGGKLEVLLVGVWEPTEGVVGGNPVRRGLTPQVLDCVQSNLRAYLSRAEARFQGLGVRTRSLLILGNPAQDVAAVAQREGADQVITGPRGVVGLRCARPRALWCRGPCPAGL